MNNSIIVCGERIPIDTRVVLWDETGGFNGYDTSTAFISSEDRKTGKIVKKKISGKRYSQRTWRTVDFTKLQSIVTQLFLHHSGLYRAKDTFNVLHNQRKLSVQLILDDDGVFYQTLDLKEKAWHGGKNNPMSIGIEIDSRAHAGRLPEAYSETNQIRYGVGPRRKRMDRIHGNWVLGYELNEKQYVSLIKLGIALKKTFPNMSVDRKCDFPRLASGGVVKGVIANPLKHHGLICHYNNSRGKIDPICLDHERLVLGINRGNPNQSSTFILLTSWKERQQCLTNLGYNPGDVDGIFGSKTKKALKEFQADHGLKADGKWGYKTDYMIDLAIKVRKK